MKIFELTKISLTFRRKTKTEKEESAEKINNQEEVSKSPKGRKCAKASLDGKRQFEHYNNVLK